MVNKSSSNTETRNCGVEVQYFSVYFIMGYFIGIGLFYNFLEKNFLQYRIIGLSYS
jgi:hypothetical protein